ncbi:hypothetical protein B566_EDAN012920 [Ephemera danica]|nr:hypothetical protein B566_EDAN012920 [Ephemera danica]
MSVSHRPSETENGNFGSFQKNIRMAMDQETRRRLAKVAALTRTVFHWGFIPTVLYLGFKTGSDPGMPELSFLSTFGWKGVEVTKEVVLRLMFMEDSRERSFSLPLARGVFLAREAVVCCSMDLPNVVLERFCCSSASNSATRQSLATKRSCSASSDCNIHTYTRSITAYLLVFQDNFFEVLHVADFLSWILVSTAARLLPLQLCQSSSQFSVSCAQSVGLCVQQLYLSP